MNPRISQSDLVAMCWWAAKDVAECFGHDATTIGATLSRYDGRVEKQPGMRRKLEKLAQTV